MWENSKTEMVRKFQIQIMTKLKKTNGDKTKKLNLWENANTQVVRKLKNVNSERKKRIKKTLIVTKTKNSNSDKVQKSNCDATQKSNFFTTLKTEVVTKS